MITAAGTSEGVRKSWLLRRKGGDPKDSQLSKWAPPHLGNKLKPLHEGWNTMQGGDAHTYQHEGSPEEALKDFKSVAEERGWKHNVGYRPGPNLRRGRLYGYNPPGGVEGHVLIPHEGKIERMFFTILAKKPMTTTDWHSGVPEQHRYLLNKASETDMKNELIECRDDGVALTASEKWQLDVPTTFQWMPGGVTTMRPNYNGRPIHLTVQCDESTANVVQGSFQSWKERFPKQEPFGCVEHREQEAAIRPDKFEWRNDPEPGVFCTGRPTELGAHNVNGRIHRSWSPTFTTDAEYHKCTCSDCKEKVDVCQCGGALEFPKGARGSASNPARVTGVAFSVGSLTNKPAFKNILPVRSKEGGEETKDKVEAVEEKVEASGTSEGVKKGWQTRQGHANNASYAANSAEDSALHRKASELHREVQHLHEKEAERTTNRKQIQFHTTMAEHHERMANHHANASEDLDYAASKASSTEGEEGNVQAGAAPGNQNAAGKHRVGKPRRNEHGEWEVPWFVDGHRHEGRTYYTDDKKDADDTHAHMTRQAEAENNKDSNHLKTLESSESLTSDAILASLAAERKAKLEASIVTDTALTSEQILASLTGKAG